MVENIPSFLRGHKKGNGENRTTLDASALNAVETSLTTFEPPGPLREMSQDHPLRQYSEQCGSSMEASVDAMVAYVDRQCEQAKERAQKAKEHVYKIAAETRRRNETLANDADTILRETQELADSIFQLYQQQQRRPE